MPKKLMTTSAIPKHEVLHCLSQKYRLSVVEYDEGLLAPEEVIRHMDLEQLKKDLWFPLDINQDTADVIVCNPEEPALFEEIKKTLKITKINLLLALPEDLIRIIENNQDVNSNFPPSAGRTPLARMRTFLAGQRTHLSWYRTSLAKGRTGLAFMRTGIAFISIGLVFLRVFGIGYLTLLEVPLIVVGLVMTVDGLLWYLPTRKIGKKHPNFSGTESTYGTTVLAFSPSGGSALTRTPPIEGAEQMRTRWNRLSPVMKRRFLAIDRTDMAEERTILANFRTVMARARTGLAFSRTGIAFIGLGIALFRQFGFGPWGFFDGSLTFVGTLLTLEGFYWSLPGRQAAIESLKNMKKIEKRASLWDFMLHPFNQKLRPDDLLPTLFLQGSPGIWGTTGLALERTVIAERRNVKARLRTIMARSRTGLALIRTGISIFSVGAVLLFFFGIGNLFWTVFNLILMVVGAFLIVDGFYWHIPAEKKSRQFPYVTGDLEILFPDYGKPTALWKKVVFSHDNL